MLLSLPSQLVRGCWEPQWWGAPTAASTALPRHPQLPVKGSSVSLQAEAAEMDGFQADTEEDEEDDDCMIVDIQPGRGGEGKR